MTRQDAVLATYSAALFVFAVTALGAIGLDRMEVAVFLLLFIFGVSLIHCGVLHIWIFWQELKMFSFKGAIYIALGSKAIFAASLNFPVVIGP